VLPVKTFSTDAWGALDADVRSPASASSAEGLPINDLQAHLILKDKVLEPGSAQLRRGRRQSAPPSGSTARRRK
jgi:hypothetical protein